MLPGLSAGREYGQNDMSEDRACLSRAEVNLSLLYLLATFYHAGPTMNAPTLGFRGASTEPFL